ncbi:DUF3006 domain-containing protein [Bifidobacterium oedipodis]|uniref:DUF3006 domain-containing protein n=1 Tax=Bifidobacterium oedipodis TaxID=2675322 RepID=A0A7Y0EMW2_9BIFI|nr:DUF3006 domain-containing protein [Bifidobacterium sp. DSM 109957]NMM93200.1 hypothetical protein [Bifidobacterium sp. DSM 109957]
MLIIDRIENDTAVVETPEGHIHVPVANIEGRVRDGAVLIEKDTDAYIVDEDETNVRAEMSKTRTKALFERTIRR